MAGKQDSSIHLEQNRPQDTTAMTRGSIAPPEKGSSVPQSPSTGDKGPRRKARNFDEKLCANGTVALPQCVSASPTPCTAVEAAGKCLPPLERLDDPQRDAAKTSWSKSAQLAANAKRTIPAKTPAELIPTTYHQLLLMFVNKNAKVLPPRRRYDFRVELLPGATPHAGRIIPLLPAENEALETLINNRLASGTIQQTTSPWAAPVLFTGKKDGNLRPCFDYRKLNAVTVKNRYPLPLTMDLVDSLLDANTFTKLDLRNAYGNLRVAKGDEDKLVFICKAGQFAPLTMPCRPTRAPGFFQYFIQDIMLGRIGKDVAAYLKDIMIYTQKGTNHTAAVTSVLETLSKHNLWLKPKKCKCLRPEVEYLGLIISCNRIWMDPAKVQAVTDWPEPRSVTELQRFIGFANFYRRFIDHFLGTTRPLHDLTKTKTAFVWDQRCEAALPALTGRTGQFEHRSSSRVRPVNAGKCDCSDFALGAVLSQVCDKDGELHPVAYLSRLLVQAEKNYEVFDKKLTTESSQPDALLRRPDLAPSKEEKLTFGQLLKPSNITKNTFAEISAFETCFVDKEIISDKEDSWFQIDVLGTENADTLPQSNNILSDVQIIQRIRELTPTDERLNKMVKDGQDTSDGLIYTRGRIEVPADGPLKTAILKSRHDSRLAGHPGRARTLALVSQCFTWPSMKRFINQYVDGCESCQRVKALTHKPMRTLEPLPIPAGPWTDICYDLITDLPESNSCDSILTVVDRLTKMAHFIPCRKTTMADELADLMLQYVWKLHAYHPCTNGQSEIANQAVEKYLRHYVQYCQDNWEQLLPTAEFAYNNNTHTSLRVSPFKANYGYDPTFGGVPTADQCLPSVEQWMNQLEEVQTELKACLEAAQEAMGTQFNKHVRTTPEWDVGEKVWLNGQNILTTRPIPKLGHKWLGPFPIASRISRSTYKLTLPLSMARIHPVFHVSMLRKHATDTVEDRSRKETDPIIVDRETEWEVKEILDCRKIGKRREYLVSWKGFGPEANSWEPHGNLNNCATTIRKFDEQYPEAALWHKRRRQVR
ncbi:hypothetical protein PCASD_04496 [Puccinia coronata f. sp. avenae]|uniref:Chromo domain-containing protein n=1 Tax=Puccinia coronata f. sp. avenae TaxID=200324 RepID=A0A2N5V2W0_9BASI|nr:hypothetical protein PCASD_04496 [Puccinia coronata f. sp. avenae]